MCPCPEVQIQNCVSPHTNVAATQTSPSLPRANLGNSFHKQILRTITLIGNFSLFIRLWSYTILVLVCLMFLILRKVSYCWHLMRQVRLSKILISCTITLGNLFYIMFIVLFVFSIPISCKNLCPITCPDCPASEPPSTNISYYIVTWIYLRPVLL